MKLKHLYLCFALLSLVLTLSQLIPFFINYGSDLVLLFRQGFETYGAGVLTMDLLGVAIAGVVFIIAEGRHLKMKRLWVPVVVTFAIGISVSLPVFLFMRENHLELEKNNESK